MLDVGEQIPDVEVWMGPREPVNLRELAREKPLLLVFYLFDWSKSQWGRELGGSSETAPHRDEQRAPGGTRMFR